MRIAFFTDTYKPQVNGVVTSIDSFASELRKLGHTVEIFSPRSEKQEGFPSIPFAPYPGYKIGLPSKSQLDRFRKKRFDIVHIHTPFSIGALGMALAKHLKLPTVFTFHTLLPEYMHYLKIPGSSRRERVFRIPKKLRFFDGVAKKGAWRYCVWFCNRADAVVAPSEEIASLLKEKGVRKPVYAVPTGVDILAQKAKRTAKKSKTLLHVGRLTKEKRIEVIIDALAELPPNIRLVIASDGPYRKELEDRVKAKGLGRRVAFTGYLSKSKLSGLYSQADLFVMASTTETQAIVLAEAAAAGLPMVVVDAPVTADFVRKNRLGWVSDEKGLADAISKALGSKKKISLPKGFTPRESAKKMFAIYRSLTG
jgi:glycosyltransferase involved in cell wall biosynthesis